MINPRELILTELRSQNPGRHIDFVMEPNTINFEPYLVLVVDGKKTPYGYNPQLITDAYQHAGDFVRRVQDKMLLL